MFMHLDIVDFISMFSAILKDKAKVSTLNPFKELLDEINMVAYDKGKHFDGFFELTFKNTDFIKNSIK